ncbi:unnamed protein product [Caenorhabditis bovis]|uniref:Uncharacterized protein n=1 Tax=Caenorhabditis bovis TaxID=2654633 RepID=A0A8S1F2S3_9PELO|nr:unnamed protein product [Caenorhabditis bovis]
MADELRHRKPSIPEKFDSDFVDDDELREIVRDIETDKQKETPVESNTRWAKTKRCLREWGASCSWHGIPHMAQSLTFLAIFLWATILLICAILLVYLMYSTICQYLKFSKVVNLNIGMDQSRFPSVTFCNTNPYKLSAVKSIPELEALLTIYAQSI